MKFRVIFHAAEEKTKYATLHNTCKYILPNEVHLKNFTIFDPTQQSLTNLYIS